MNVADVLDEVAQRLDAIPGLRVHAWGEKRVTPPAILLPYPPVDYDLTGGRGSDEYEFAMIIVVGDHSARASRNALSLYTDGGSTEHSVKHAVETRAGSEYASCEAVVINRFDPDTVRFAGTDYLGGTFRGTIVGKGAD